MGAIMLFWLIFSLSGRYEPDWPELILVYQICIPLDRFLSNYDEQLNQLEKAVNLHIISDGDSCTTFDVLKVLWF